MTQHRIVEDPRIADVAKLEHDEMLAEVCRRWINGEDFFHARTCVMAERGNDIAKTYGKDVSTRALQALTSIEPKMLPGRMHSQRDVNTMQKSLPAIDSTRGGTHEWTPRRMWLGRNQHHFDQALVVAITMIVCCPIVGFFIFMATGYHLSIWWKSTLWSAGLGLFILIAMELVRFVCKSGSLRRLPGTEPKTPEAVEAQRTIMNAVDQAKYVKGLQDAADRERDAKQRDDEQRKHARSLKHMADATEREAEILARNERRRHGKSLPSDPPYIPMIPRRERSKPGNRRQEVNDAIGTKTRRNGVLRPSTEGYVPRS